MKTTEEQFEVLFAKYLDWKQNQLTQNQHGITQQTICPRINQSIRKNI
jgi:hypothetical protein